jgi:putative tryptophan/tyrosine transport system substrate-binding protein
MPLFCRQNFARRKSTSAAPYGLAAPHQGAPAHQGRNLGLGPSSASLCGGWSNRLRGLAAALLLLAGAPAALAQVKPLEIGVLALGPRNIPVWSCGPGGPAQGATEPQRETIPFYVLGLMNELGKLDYIEDRPENARLPGRRFNLDIRMGNRQELIGFADEFAHKPVDFIVAVATTAVRIAQEQTREHPIPILFPGISDPVADGFVQSLAHPGGFITGVSHQQVQGSGKRVEMFKEMLPGLRRLITLRRTDYAPAEKSMVEIRAAAARLKVDVLDWTVTNRAELQAALTKVDSETADGIMILPDALIISNLDLVLATSLARRVPVFGLQDFMADWGALGSYGPSAYQAGARVARYIDKITKGAKPGDLPVEPIDPMMVINLKAAACLGVSVPDDVLRQADRIIR